VLQVLLALKEVQVLPVFVELQVVQEVLDHRDLQVFKEQQVLLALRELQEQEEVLEA
jgi:hypothetical protein